MSIRRLFFLLILVLAGTAIFFAYPRLESDAPLLEGPARIALGRNPGVVVLRADDPGSGLRRVIVRVVPGGQAGDSRTLTEREQPGDLASGGLAPAPEEIELELDARKLGLPEGESTLVVEARDWSWRDRAQGNPAQLRIPILVDSQPPLLRIESGLTYMKRGGSAAAIYHVQGGATRDGVRVGDAFFWGFPAGNGSRGAADAPAERGKHPRADGWRLALFAVPVESQWPVEIEVIAEDEVGNLVAESFPARPRDRNFGDELISLSNAFLEGAPRRLAETHEMIADTPLATFQRVNAELRAWSEARVREIVAQTSPEKLWRGAFHQMTGSRVMSKFAEARSYSASGSPKIVSRARHYGFDLASTAHAPITASNAGRVLFADELGIYGRCVILDHGYGLTSLYAHLSSIEVKPGQQVAQGQQLGRSGQTGLAGGDHLHFAVLLGETYVDPVEWWDPKWVSSHIDDPISRLLGNASSGPAGSASQASLGN